MRDPFDSAPALRLGDAPARRLIAESREARSGIKEGYGPGPLTDEQKSRLDEAWDALGIGEIFAKAMELRDAKKAEEAKKPPSLDPAFGDAFGAALSKPRTRSDLVDWIEKHGVYDPAKENLALEIERMVKAVSEEYAVPANLLKGPDPAQMTATQKAELDRYFDRFTLPVYPSFAQVDAEVLSEEEFARRYPESVPIVFDEAAPVPLSAWKTATVREPITFRRLDETDSELRERIRANQAAFVAEKDASK